MVIKIEEILNKIKIEFSNMEILKQAITHSSYAHENSRNNVSHNERLEFLGDAVLELVISEYLYVNYPELNEGDLTRLRANIVCESSLVRVAKFLNLGEYILLGKGELAAGGKSRPSILANSLEALIGAVYLDKGYGNARSKILNLFKPVIEEIKEGDLNKDYKTLVQEYTQAEYSLTPEYKIVDEIGPDHNKIFVAQVLFKEKVIGEGRGRNKKEAEQAAASVAWSKLKQ